MEVFRFVKDAEILLPPPTMSSPREFDERVCRLDQQALATTPIKVPARP